MVFSFFSFYFSFLLSLAFSLFLFSCFFLFSNNTYSIIIYSIIIYSIIYYILLFLWFFLSFLSFLFLYSFFFFSFSFSFIFSFHLSLLSFLKPPKHQIDLVEPITTNLQLDSLKRATSRIKF